MGKGDIISYHIISYDVIWFPDIHTSYLTVFPWVVEFMETYDIMIYVFIPSGPSPMMIGFSGIHGTMALNKETCICETMSFKRCILRIENAVDI